MRLTDPLSQEEITSVFVQALGILLTNFQKDMKTDHLTIDFEGFMYLLGVRENSVIDVEKHTIEEPSKLITLDEFKDGK